MMNDDIVVLVPSRDRDADLWPTLLQSYRRFWPDCPFRMVVLTGELRARQDHAVLCPMGREGDDATRLRAALRSIPSSHVLLQAPHQVLVAPPDVEALDAALVWSLAHDAAHVRLDLPAQEADDGLVAELSPRQRDRRSIGAGLWRTSALDRLLPHGAVGAAALSIALAQALRRDGPARAPDFGPVARTLRPVLRVADLVVDGRWDPWAVARARAAGLDVAYGTRPTLTCDESDRLHAEPWPRRALRWLLPRPGPALAPAACPQT